MYLNLWLSLTSVGVALQCYASSVGAISQRDLRNDSGAVLRRVEAGEVITVTRRGIPVADLVPHLPEVREPARDVPAARIVEALRDLPDWDAPRFEAEQRDVDPHLDDEWRDPWSAR